MIAAGSFYTSRRSIFTDLRSPPTPASERSLHQALNDKATRTMQFQFLNDNSEVSRRRSTDIATPTCAQFEFLPFSSNIWAFPPMIVLRWPG